MGKYNILTDKLNNYFTNNSIKIASEQPNSGSWKKGDLVLSNSLTQGIFGWMCTADGTPGSWMILKTLEDLTGNTNVESHYHDNRYYKKTEINDKLDQKSNIDHLHDDRYYTEEEMTRLLEGKSDTDHKHGKDFYYKHEIDEWLADKADKNHRHGSDFYYKNEIDEWLANKAEKNHKHGDDFYYKWELNDWLAGKAEKNHSHGDIFYYKYEIDSKIKAQEGRTLYLYDWDPGAIGAGSIWIKTS